jgi:hypothetical protein
MAILRSSHKAVEAKSQQPKSFKELVSRIGQRSQLAAPKYADSTKLVNNFVWGRWTQYVYDHIIAFFFLLGRRLTIPTRFCQKVYDETNHFTTPDPIEVCRKHVDYQVVRSFLEWSCQTSKFKKASSLFTHAKAWRMGVIQYTRAPVDPAVKMDMKNVRNHGPVFLRCVFSLLRYFFAVHHGHLDRPIRARGNWPI